MERLLQNRLGSDYRVTSAGVSAQTGRGMHPYSAESIERYGGYTGAFEATRLTPALLAEADLVLAATRELRDKILEIDPSALKRTFTLREFAVVADVVAAAGDDVATPTDLVRVASARRSDVGLSYHDLDIADPIGQRRKVHIEIAEQIADAVERIARVMPDAVGEPLADETASGLVPRPPLRDHLATRSARTYVGKGRLLRARPRNG